MDITCAFLDYSQTDLSKAGICRQSLSDKAKGYRDFRFNFSKIVSFVFLLLFFQGEAVQSSWDGVVVMQADYQALQDIKHELVDPIGVLRSWNDTGYGACNGGWAGIKCVKGQVIAIQLPYKGLGGRISEKIGQLQGLRKLSLHSNYLAGTVPWSLGFLPNLRGVYLFNNRLSGSIPSTIGNCRGLQHLDLSNNRLIGKIPPSLANSTRLYRLNLGFNSLSGSIPGSIYNLSSLVILSLENNRLGNELPEGFGKLRNLSLINLSNNGFKGRIPGSLGNISGVSQIDLSRNAFTGEIPDSLASLANLTSFNVSHNNLSGAVPTLLSKKFNSSSFAGNLQLCGFSASTQCPSPPPLNLPAPPQGSPSHQQGRKLRTKDIILIAAGALLAVLLLVCCILLICLMKNKAALKEKSPKAIKQASTVSTEKSAAAVETGETGGKLVHFDGPFVFTADDLLCATAEIMGKSAYGTTYKATLEVGNQVAVKRLREKTTKGQKDFETEVAALGKIRHPNLLALRAYYLGPKGEKLLVFDNMPKGSLASFLHARGPETVIPWPSRKSIALGVSHGLNHLHTQENIIHGNLTSSNILLDEQNNAHIADYGLSRLMTTAASTNMVATAGTVGYSAPELSKTKKPTTKTDVYSLGVIILELLTGKSPSEGQNGENLPQWVASIVKEEWTNEVFDLELTKDSSTVGDDELLDTLKLALHCVDPCPEARPEVQQVIEKLEEIKPEMAAGPSSE